MRQQQRQRDGRGRGRGTRRATATTTNATAAVLAFLVAAAQAQASLPQVDTPPVRPFQVEHDTIGRVPATAAGNGNGTSPASTHADPPASLGRYGHSAVYLPYQKRVLFIGGQVGTEGTFITNDVLALDMSQDYSADSGVASISPGSSLANSLPSNPARLDALSLNLPPSAWASCALDAMQRVWLIGGVTKDCENDASAYVLDMSLGLEAGWIPLAPGGSRPPRRRQAQAVALSNGSYASSIHVFAGIAEPYTCSLETVGYLAMDSWNTTGVQDKSAVETVPWRQPGQDILGIPPLHKRNGDETERKRQEERIVKLYPDGPPVSDYAAAALGQGKDGLVYLGGQDATGRLLAMESALLYNTTTSDWSVQLISGQAPDPRIGLTATTLTDDLIVVLGGSGVRGAPERSLYLLNVSLPNEWAWSQPELAPSSMPSPSRSWHTSTLTSEGVLVVAFGLDAETHQTTEDIMFLQTTENGSQWEWTQANPLASAGTRSPVVAAVVESHMPVHAASGTVTAQANALVQAAAATFLSDSESRPHNPKADLVAGLPGGNDPNGNDGYVTDQPATYVPATSAPPTQEPSIADTAPPSASATRSSSSRAAASSTTSSNTSDGQSAFTQTGAGASTTTKAIAGSVTALFVLAVGAGLVGLYMRKKAAKAQAAAGPTPALMSEAGHDGSGAAGALALPPVSQLLYTRAAPRRMLSLGSSIHTSLGKGTSGEAGRQTGARGRRGHRNENSEGAFEALSAQEAREAVDEFGRLPQVAEGPSGEDRNANLGAMPVLRRTVRPGVPHMASSASVESHASAASVASMPFLGSVPIISSLTAAGLSGNGSGNGMPPRTLLRSHSMSTASSATSRSEYSAAALTAPMPSAEFGRARPIGPSTVQSVEERTGDLSDPFADFEEVRQDALPMRHSVAPSSPARIRNMHNLPPALRPHTPAHL